MGIKIQFQNFDPIDFTDLLLQKVTADTSLEVISMVFIYDDSQTAIQKIYWGGIDLDIGAGKFNGIIEPGDQRPIAFFGKESIGIKPEELRFAVLDFTNTPQLVVGYATVV